MLWIWNSISTTVNLRRCSSHPYVTASVVANVLPVRKHQHFLLAYVYFWKGRPCYTKRDISCYNAIRVYVMRNVDDPCSRALRTLYSPMTLSTQNMFGCFSILENLPKCVLNEEQGLLYKYVMTRTKMSMRSNFSDKITRKSCVKLATISPAGLISRWRRPNKKHSSRRRMACSDPK